LLLVWQQSKEDSLRKNDFILSFRAERGISLRFNRKKTKKERFLAPLGMTEMARFSAACDACPAQLPYLSLRRIIDSLDEHHRSRWEEAAWLPEKTLLRVNSLTAPR
jgi:hypothetical protein